MADSVRRPVVIVHKNLSPRRRALLARTTSKSGRESVHAACYVSHTSPYSIRPTMTVLTVASLKAPSASPNVCPGLFGLWELNPRAASTAYETVIHLPLQVAHYYSMLLSDTCSRLGMQGITN